MKTVSFKLLSRKPFSVQTKRVNFDFEYLGTIEVPDGMDEGELLISIADHYTECSPVSGVSYSVIVEKEEHKLDTELRLETYPFSEDNKITYVNSSEGFVSFFRDTLATSYKVHTMGGDLVFVVTVSTDPVKMERRFIVEIDNELFAFRATEKDIADMFYTIIGSYQ